MIFLNNAIYTYISAGLLIFTVIMKFIYHELLKVLGDHMYLDSLSTFEFEKRLKSNPKTTVILPIGAVEEHGSHLPLSTDSLQPEFVAETIAKDSDLDVLIAPPIRYGICNATRNFPGTVSLSFDTFRNLICEVLSELCRHGVQNLVVLSGHAGRVHMAALRVAAESVLEEYDINLMVLSDYDIIYKLAGDKFPSWDGHAGSVETSRVLAIRPELVTGKGEMFKAEFPEYQVTRNPEKYFPNGVMGDPTTASAEKGVEWNELVIIELKKLIAQMVNSNE
jgi:creatinine amidohydrolase